MERSGSGRQRLRTRGGSLRRQESSAVTLKSKALRERWLLDGPPTAGPQHDEVKRQLEQDEDKTRNLEKTISRLEQELVTLETGVCPTNTHSKVTSDSVVEGKGHSNHQMGGASTSEHVVQDISEVRVHKSPQVTKARPMDEMKKAMYSVEIKVERDRVTGETRVLSTNTTLPVDLSHYAVKVYEDEQKVVHEMNGEDGVHLLSCSEVEELIHKADEASMMSQAVTTVTSLPTTEVQEEAGPEPDIEPEPSSQQGPELAPQVAAEIRGLETRAHGELSVAEASEENPVIMVFMGYQSVEDEDETKRVLGLQGTVKAELVLIDDTDGKVDPPPPSSTVPPTSTTLTTSTAPPASYTSPTFTPLSASDVPPTSSKPAEAMTSNGETGGEAEGGMVEVEKDKQPCKCCSIM
ncbi:paralemmin 1a isoform X2 [Melanotaenia boesemani]|uniref:paralemmin 1a isoform X2 n=1 Tax=Melanotaenia boesemani TaxID=1250792 RepID=UPI001C053369|nr:paralemmin 1a isoform X2 [Melanotaenia boesemani]